ncbi:MAG: hypothetical protein PHF86_14130 [Candidatus Nanoarchaeia archaeon]|jgi:CBS domain containing-hemolysin-like protein|nr:hypothetical protein [Candidatus Nanoarchaeia archaeon]
MGKIISLILTILFIIASLILIFNGKLYFDLCLGISLIFGLLTIVFAMKE